MEKDLSEKESGTYPQGSGAVSNFFTQHYYISCSLFAKRIGINASLMRQYKLGRAPLGRKQKKRILDAIHQLGEELQRFDWD